MQPDRAVIVRNLRAAMSAYVRSTRRGAACEMGAAGAYHSGLDYPVFNAMVLSEPVSMGELAKLLGAAQAFYRKEGKRWSCWLDEAMVETPRGLDTARLLESLGLRWIAEHEGMMAAEIRPARRKVHAIDARPVDDERSRADFVEICSRVFLLPPDTARDVYGAAGFWSGEMRGWVGYDEDEPVSIAVTAAAAGCVGLYSVATLPTHRRRGYGESITRHALGEAMRESGLTQSILQSTPAGRSLYTRMGYQGSTRISVWACP